MLMIDLHDKLHKAFKEKCVKEGRSMSSVIRLFIEEYVEKGRGPYYLKEGEKKPYY